MRKFLVVLLVLVVGGLIIADRVVKARAEEEIAREVSAQQRLTSQPEVSIGGFPFLTQALGGTYEQIDVSIGDYTQQGVTVRDVKVRLNDLNAPLGDLINGNKSNLVARKASASAVVPYEVLEQQLAERGVKNVSRDGENVLLEGQYSFGGLSTDVGVVVSIKVIPQGIRITPEKLAAAGGLVQVPIAVIREQLAYTIPVTGLPLGSKITDVSPVADGLRVSGSAADVRFSELQNVPVGR